MSLDSSEISKRFKVIENELLGRIDKSVELLSTYTNMLPKQAANKLLKHKEEMTNLRSRDYRLRTMLNNDEFELLDDNKQSAIMRAEERSNGRFKQFLDDKRELYNHLTTYGIFLATGIGGMMYLASRK